MTYVSNDSLLAAHSLAVEEFLLNNVTDGTILMLWKSAPTVVIGKFQNAYAEVSLCELMKRGISLVRRNSGGGTVYHDGGNLNFTFIADCGESSPDYERFLSPVVRALRRLGINAELGSAFDITVDGKKVSGNAQSVLRGRVMHHGTLLFDSDLDVLSSVTGHASESVRSRAIASRPSPVCNLRPYLKHDMGISEFTEYLKNELCGGDIGERAFTPTEEREIERLRDEKYLSWEWNLGRSPKFTKDCGDFSAEVTGGIITAVHGNAELEKILVGHRMELSELCEAVGEDLTELILG